MEYCQYEKAPFAESLKWLKWLKPVELPRGTRAAAVCVGQPASIVSPFLTANFAFLRIDRFQYFESRFRG